MRAIVLLGQSAPGDLFTFARVTCCRMKWKKRWIAVHSIFRLRTHADCPGAGWPGAILPAPVPAAFAPANREGALGHGQQSYPSRNRFLIAAAPRKSRSYAAWNPGFYLLSCRTSFLPRSPFHHTHIFAPRLYRDGRLRKVAGFFLTRLDIRLTELIIFSENALMNLNAMTGLGE